MGKKKAKVFEPRKCVVCGTEFMPRREEHICCCSKCSQKRWRIMNGLFFESDMKKCVICGTEFLQKSTRHICCSEKCQRKRNAMISKEPQKKRYHEQREKQKAQEAMPESNHKAIADIAIAARAEGLTYGQYVAKYMRRM